ncbi:hypothetical protein ACIOC1_00310 [Streptomyces sp. NPDC088197]|uniref:hypothetical protein n=1 Tax=unclassified Streptomyces TaxID=2593676 RepID=UPI00380B6E0F
MPVDRLSGLSPLDLARVLRIAGMAAIRKDVLTTRQEKAIDRIAERARQRREQKENTK